MESGWRDWPGSSRIGFSISKFRRDYRSADFARPLGHNKTHCGKVPDAAQQSAVKCGMSPIVTNQASSGRAISMIETS
jgi:hypothetical protein